MLITCKGQRVLVTAGAAGIGRTIVEHFLAAGARVHCCDIDEAAIAACSEALSSVGCSRTDVADPAAVDRLFETVEAELGGLDVLVNNAGIAGPTQPVEAISNEDWGRTLAVNVSGQFYCARRAVPLLRAAGGGAIVNLSSAAGRLGYPLRTPYAASKWAVVGLTKSLAIELGPDRIRVNALLPGLVEGERIRKVIADKAEARGVSEDEMLESYLSSISLGSMTSPHDVANMAVYLASDLGRIITGAAIPVDGSIESLR